MKLYQRIKEAIWPTVVNPVNSARPVGFNQGVSIYPYGRDHTYISKGYQKNAWVYAIVSKCAKKFSQIPWYHYKIRTSERKTWFDEYVPLTKNGMGDGKAMIEAKRMRKKSVEQVAVDSPISKILNQPNHNQARAAFMENLYGYKLLTGEGNIWLSRLASGERPKELYIIPKANLALVKGGSPWEVARYKLLMAGQEFTNPVENVMMWKFPNYDFDPVLLSHLRGQSPLDAGLLLMQSSNEAAERMIAMNKNQGVAGVMFDKDRKFGDIKPEASAEARRQFNALVNDSDMAGSVGLMFGNLDYIQFGLDAAQLKLLEQSDVQFKALCNIFDVPWQLFGNADSYENRKQYKRDFVYDNIAVAAYGLRDELNGKLIKEFSLDRERDVIDCDVMSLPELAADLKDQIEALTKAIDRAIITPNQARKEIGHEESPDPNMNKYYMTSSLVPLDQVNVDLGGGLDNEVDLLDGE